MHAMSDPLKYARKAAFGIVGVVLIIIGIALLVLPGPGLLVIFAGLFVLSLEFEQAKPYVDKVRTKLKEVSNKAKGASRTHQPKTTTDSRKKKTKKKT